MKNIQLQLCFRLAAGSSLCADFCFWNLTLVYGSLGGIIALLVWLFISAQLIILGGEVNAMLIFSRGTKNRVSAKPD